MFSVEVTYRTGMGNLSCRITSSQAVESMAQAEAVRDALAKAMPDLLSIKIKGINPPTVDGALDAFNATFARYPVYVFHDQGAGRLVGGGDCEGGRG